MDDWHAWVEAIRADLEAGRLEAATSRLGEALAACPDQLWLLVTASDVYRAAGEHDTALLYAKKLLLLYPHTFHGYCRGAEDLARLGRLEQAHALIQRGLERFPGEFWVWVVAGDLHRQQGQREQSLACARALIEAHPQQASGYSRTAQDLLALRRFSEAETVIEAGLQRCAGDLWLLIVGHEVVHHAKQPERSLPPGATADCHLPGALGGLRTGHPRPAGPEALRSGPGHRAARPGAGQPAPATGAPGGLRPPLCGRAGQRPQPGRGLNHHAVAARRDRLRPPAGLLQRSAIPAHQAQWPTRRRRGQERAGRGGAGRVSAHQPS
jgi:hypothetical protein